GSESSGSSPGDGALLFAASVHEMPRLMACRRADTHVRRQYGRGESMTFRGDTAVLVLASGPGTRMRSDTPKVLHTIAGRRMLSHSLHAITKLAPQHLVAVHGHDHERIAPLVVDLADTLGRRIDVALQDRPRGTGHAVLCGLTALPDD